MSRIFISYRRSDTEADAGRLYQTLRSAFGDSRLFKDVDSIGLGEDFRDAIVAAMAETAALIVVIGPNWLESDSRGDLRLANTADPVRMEIETAKSSDVPIIPVRVRRAEMPTEGDLPDSLGWLAYLNAAELEHSSWERDATPLIEHLKTLGLVERDGPGGKSDAIDPDQARATNFNTVPKAAMYKELRKKLSFASKADLAISQGARESLNALTAMILGDQLKWFAHTQGLQRTFLGDAFLAIATDRESGHTRLVYVGEEESVEWDISNLAAAISGDRILIHSLLSGDDFSFQYNSGDPMDGLLDLMNPWPLQD